MGSEQIVMAKSLTDIAFWRKRQASGLRLRQGGVQPRWIKHVRDLLPAASGASVLEIGVVPGGMLLYLASRLGFRATGIDFSPNVKSVEQAFIEQNVEADFIETDLFTWQPDRRFDIVYSCGFVEHFDTLDEPLQAHWQLVKPGGLLIVTVPAMTPYQYYVRRLTYTRQRWHDMTASHNLDSMQLEPLRDAVARLDGCHVLRAKPIREMEIWFSPFERGIRWWTIPLFLPLKALDWLSRLIGVSSLAFSPEVMVAARKQTKVDHVSQR